MDRLPLNALRAFALVLERGGVRAAARELEVSHSAVSRHLRELERWLGVALFAKSGARGLRATPPGRRLAEVARRSLAEIQQAVEALREHRSSHAVSVSTTPSFAARWLLPRLPALQRAYPRLEVSVVVDQRLDDAEAFTADLAIRVGRGPWPGLVAEPLMNESIFPVMSPALWRQAGRPADPAALPALRLLHDRDPNMSWLLWRQKHGPPALDVRRGARFASSDLLLRAAAQGLGVALACGQLVQEDLAAGVLVQPFGTRAVELGPAYWIVRPPGSPARAAVRTLIGWLRHAAVTRRAPAGAA